MRNPRLTGTRVEIPAYTDAWMRGDRYGEIIQTFRHWQMKRQGMSKPVVHVKLDKSGKIVRLPIDDCEVI